MHLSQWADNVYGWLDKPCAADKADTNAHAHTHTHTQSHTHAHIELTVAGTGSGAGISMCLGPDNVKNCLCSDAFALFAMCVCGSVSVWGCVRVYNGARFHLPNMSLPLPLARQSSLCYFHFTLFGCWLKHDIYWLTTWTWMTAGVGCGVGRGVGCGVGCWVEWVGYGALSWAREAGHTFHS